MPRGSERCVGGHLCRAVLEPRPNPEHGPLEFGRNQDPPCVGRVPGRDVRRRVAQGRLLCAVFCREGPVLHSPWPGGTTPAVESVHERPRVAAPGDCPSSWLAGRRQRAWLCSTVRTGAVNPSPPIGSAPSRRRIRGIHPGAPGTCPSSWASVNPCASASGRDRRGQCGFRRTGSWSAGRSWTGPSGARRRRGGTSPGLSWMLRRGAAWRSAVGWPQGDRRARAQRGGEAPESHRRRALLPSRS